MNQQYRVLNGFGRGSIVTAVTGERLKRVVMGSGAIVGYSFTPDKKGNYIMCNAGLCRTTKTPIMYEYNIRDLELIEE